MKLYHVGHVPDAVLDGNQIYCGDTAIYELSSGENGRAYTNALNQGIRKDRGERVVSDFDIDKRGKKDASDWGLVTSDWGSLVSSSRAQPRDLACTAGISVCALRENDVLALPHIRR